MEQVKPALEAAGAKYLSRGGAHKIYEGDWVGKPLVLHRSGHSFAKR